jgi:hypothetical protein
VPGHSEGAALLFLKPDEEATESLIAGAVATSRRTAQESDEKDNDHRRIGDFRKLGGVGEKRR